MYFICKANASLINFVSKERFDFLFLSRSLCFLSVFVLSSSLFLLRSSDPKATRSLFVEKSPHSQLHPDTYNINHKNNELEKRPVPDGVQEPKARHRPMGHRRRRSATFLERRERFYRADDLREFEQTQSASDAVRLVSPIENERTTRFNRRGRKRTNGVDDGGEVWARRSVSRVVRRRV